MIEIVAPGGNYDYEHKYFSDDTQYFCPADLPADVAADVAAVAEIAPTPRWVARVGAGSTSSWTGENRPWLLEMNTSPGMTGHSLVPMAARAVGMSLCRPVRGYPGRGRVQKCAARRDKIERDACVWNDARTINLIANTLAVLAVAAMLLAGVAWVAQRPYFTLAAIEIESMPETEMHYVSTGAVRWRSRGAWGQFLYRRPDEAREAFESVPWVRHATVRRIWPNTLRVRVEGAAAAGAVEREPDDQHLGRSVHRQHG